MNWDQKLELLKEINFISQFLQKNYRPAKLNVANLGNIVSQLHIHLIARFENDKSFPRPVWGFTPKEKYTDEDLLKITEKLKNFITNYKWFFNENHNIINKLIYMIITRISNTCENKALEILEKLDRNMLVKLCGIFTKYADVFHFSEDFLKNIQQVLSNKINKDECIILNPFLDDLFENNLYRLSVSGKTYYIPLWHNELVYDNSGCDLYVKCSTLLPENMEIDERNNLHVFVKYPVQDLLTKDRVLLECSKQTFSFSPSQLKVVRTQTLVLPHSGISCINIDNIYDVSKKADVIIHVELD